MSTAKEIAPAGHEWVCGGCGRHWTGSRYDGKDTSCVKWAQLCASPPRIDEKGAVCWTAVGAIQSVVVKGTVTV